MPLTIAVLEGGSTVGWRKLQDIGDGRSKTLNLLRRELGAFTNELIIPGRMKAALRELSDRDVIRLVFINVRDSQLRLPIERVGGAIEYVLQLRNRPQDELERRASKIIAGGASPLNDHGIRLPVHFPIGFGTARALRSDLESWFVGCFIALSAVLAPADENPLPEMGQQLEPVADIRLERIRVGRRRNAIAL